MNKLLSLIVVIAGLAMSSCASTKTCPVINGSLLTDENGGNTTEEKVGLKTAGDYIPDYAFTDPADAVSVLHPDQIEENGIKKICTFIGIMDPALFTEVIIVGGVWPTIALDNNNGQMYKGYCYLENVNYFGDFILRFVFLPLRKS